MEGEDVCAATFPPDVLQHIIQTQRMPVIPVLAGDPGYLGLRHSPFPWPLPSCTLRG